MKRKFFTLEPGEEFLGVLRPSVLTLIPRASVIVLCLVFPVFFWGPLLQFGLLPGLAMSIGLVVWGAVMLRGLQRRYVENGVYLTSYRALDVYVGWRAVRVTELRWANVEQTAVLRRGIASRFGYGHICVRGADPDGYSLLVGPLWNPDAVCMLLPKVY